jgi:hypothetical protein
MQYNELNFHSKITAAKLVHFLSYEIELDESLKLVINRRKVLFSNGDFLYLIKTSMAKLTAAFFEA